MTAETSNARGEWVLVPVKPTEAMREAFHDWRPSAGGNYAGAQSVNSQARWEFRQRYAAMLAAAPSPAAAPHQPVGVNEGFVSRLAEALTAQGWDVDPDGDGSGIAQLRTAALAAQQQGGGE